MKTRLTTFAIAATLCSSALAVFSIQGATPVERTGSGRTSAAIADIIAAFRQDIGGENNGVSTNDGPVFTTGRREINWDAAALPVEMPSNFFNDRSKRGAVFSTPGSGFRVSDNSADAATRLFGDINLLYPIHFNTNSPHRLFTAMGSTTVDVHFFVPSSPATAATVTAFGAVFTDVEVEGLTRLEYFDDGGALLATVSVPVSGNAGLSFAGLSLADGGRIARVRITSGNVPPASGTVEDQTHDVVVMDDFIYSEPQAVPAATGIVSAAGPTAAELAAAIAAFREQIGGVNNGVSTNGGPTFTTGRREINWDAAALPADMPPDFFNDRSKRGALFWTPGSGFRVSGNSPDAATRLFGDLNPEYPTQFNTNSPHRLFAALGSSITEAQFFVPSRPSTPATVTAFGAVFTDVEVAGATRLEYFDASGALLATVPVPVSGNGGLSFAGRVFTGGERIARVRITTGNVPPGAGTVEDQVRDVVVMDDFIYSEPQEAPPPPGVVSAAGSGAAHLAAAIAAFRDQIGGANNGVSTNDGPTFTTGRREINWDAGALPVEMPPDFFNDRSKRGAVFATPGSGFRVSENSGETPTRLFGDLNLSYPGEFNTNSPHRLFTAVGSTVVDVHFFVPSNAANPATVTAFGAVFTDVEVDGLTKLEYFDLSDRPLATVPVPVSGRAGLSFAGRVFAGGERIARVRITSGNLPPADGTVEDQTQDVVVMDDFIYAEPQPISQLFTAAAASAEALAPALNQFRAALSGANNGVSTNGGPVFAEGRREINWDAGGLPEAMPPDFFNTRSLRGAVFATEGTGFLVSSNSASAPERLFGNLHPDYATQFNTNSPNRIFSAAGSPVLEAEFFVPAQPAVAASIHAFGAVFTDVELLGSSRIQLFGVDGQLLGAVTAPPSASGGLSFAGIVLPAEQRAAVVRITSGNAVLGPEITDSATQDVVAMDDFIYSEPQPLPSSDAPTLVGIARAADGVVTLLLQGTAGLSYVVEHSSDLRQWTPLITQGPGTVTDPSATGQAARFYRARLER